jgi:hypothetical protein
LEVQGFDVDTDVLHRAANECRRLMDDIADLSTADLLPGRAQYGDADAITSADDFAARYGYATGVMAQLVGAHGDDLDASSFSYGEVDGVAACVFQPES